MCSVVGNLENEEDIDNIIETGLKKFGTVDVLVCISQNFFRLK